MRRIRFQGCLLPPAPPVPAAVLYTDSQVGQRADAVQLYHTGSAWHDIAQLDPDLSLGRFRSNTRAGGLGFLLHDPRPGIVIDYVSGSHELGDGSLMVVGADQVRWTAPGGSPGRIVNIAAGQQRILEDGDDTTQFIIITRRSDATDDLLIGSCTVQVTDVINEVIAQSNGQVSVLGSGATTYRCVAFVARQLVQNLRIWVAEGSLEITGSIAIAYEMPTAQPNGSVQSIVSQTTAPTGVTFTTADEESDGSRIEIAEMRPNDWVGVWIRRNLSLYGSTSAYTRIGLGWSFNEVT